MKNLRHERDCRICHHPQRQEIEHDFCAWLSPTRMAKLYGISRSTIYLHAAANGLMEQRRKNVREALSRFIERCDCVRPTANAFVSAVVALSKLNEQGQTVDRHLSVSDLNASFYQFTRGELEAFARDGTLPEWYKAVPADTGTSSTKRAS